MNTAKQQATAFVQTILASKPAEGVVITRELIENEVDRVLSIFPGLQGTSERQSIIEDLEARFHVWIGNVKTLGDNTDHIAWLPKRRSEINWSHWARYRLMLLPRIAEASLERLDEISDETLSRLEDPLRVGSWSRRGLVVGHVQSGKTANYIGLICKAADSGYKLIIILAGMHRNLRAQTQMRLDEGFLGYDTGSSDRNEGAIKPLGAGLIDPSVRPDSITNRSDDGDFKKSIASNFNISPGGKPLLFVVKKNGSVLKNLLEWVEWAANSKDPETDRPVVRNVPLLVIDDEADQGSVDTKEIEEDEMGVPDLEHSPTIINGRIRRLLHCFDQSAYVGYTATPFANIYIHEKAATLKEGEDLFPRSFIMNLPTPSNYFGPEQIFGEGSPVEGEPAGHGRLHLVRRIADNVDDSNKLDVVGWMPLRHSNGHVPKFKHADCLPPSLAEAIRSFVLACAARASRGQALEHKSMLVHVTRFTNVQRAVYRQITEELTSLRSRWRNGDGASTITLRDDLQTLWNDDFVSTTAEAKLQPAMIASWAEIEPFIWDALSSITVKEINGSSADVLEYYEHRQTGLNVIAVGGDKLSRGLTLEGLTVSYFLRGSRMYDTLMQMGRWFGYRPGYADLCRLYMTSELEEWFGHIASASDELREQFDHMAAVGATPREYGLRVRSHPVLLVTSAVKSRTSTDLQLSYAGDVCETITFNRDMMSIQGNSSLTDGFIQSLDAPSLASPELRLQGEGRFVRWEGVHVWRDIDGVDVARYVKDLRVPHGANRVVPDLLSKYIQAQIGRDELTQWTVALMAGRHSAPLVRIAELSVNLVERGQKETSDSNIYRIGRLLSPKDEGLDLTEAQYSSALKETQEAWLINRGRSKRETPPDTPSGPMLRRQRAPTNGLLLIYPINSIEAFGEANIVPLIGVVLSFPSSNTGVKVSYTVNNIFREQEFGGAQ
jgi:hypothetical protein